VIKPSKNKFLFNLFKNRFDDTAITQENLTSVKDPDFDNRNVLVGVIKNTAQLGYIMKYNFYHIPLNAVNECSFPVKYIAIYQSHKLFGANAGIRFFGEVKSCKTVSRREIHEIPKNSDEQYLYFTIKKWCKLEKRAIYAREMNGVAFSTTLFLLNNASDSTELQLRSREEYDFYHNLLKTIRSLVADNISDHPDIVYKDYTLKLKGGLLYLYFAEVLEYVIGYDTFLENPLAVVGNIFDYYPEL